MTSKEKKQIYEDIIQSVAKVVKRQILESDEEDNPRKGENLPADDKKNDNDNKDNAAANKDAAEKKSKLTPQREAHIDYVSIGVKNMMTKSYEDGDDITPSWILTYLNCFAKVVKYNDKELLKKLQAAYNDSDISVYVQKKYSGRLGESKKTKRNSRLNENKK